MPGVTLPARSRAGDAYAELNDIVAVRQGEAYAVGAVSYLRGETRIIREAIVLRWDGTSWRRLPHRPAETAYTKVAPDGAGGLWLAASRQDRPDELTHYTGGAWTRVPLSARNAAIRGLANVPGTTFMWATAEAAEAGVTRRLILAYR